MRDRPTWRLPTLRGVRELILRADLTEDDAWRALGRLALRGEARGWALDPLTRDVFRDVHAALEGVNPAEHRPDAVEEMVARVELAIANRELVALRIPALVAGGGVPGEDPEDPPEPGDPPEDPANDDPRIVSVQWVEGTSTISGGTQWVNLPRDAKWVDGARVTSLDRCSFKPHVRVAFDRPGAHHFKLKLSGDAGNPVYSGAEKGRNAKFTFEEAEKDYTTNGDGTRVVPGDLFLTVAGASSWTVAGKDDYGHEARSGALAAKRLVYYVELPMAGLTTVATSLSTMAGEFASHGAEMVSAGRQEMTHMPNVSTTDTATFQSNARTAYQASGASAKEPFVIAIAYTDHLAVKDAGQVVQKTGVTVGPGAAAVSVPIVNAAGDSKSLWKNLVPGEGWFVSASYQTDAGGAAVAIPEASCTAVPTNASVPDNCSAVSIDVTALPAGTGTITLTVDWVNRMRGGVSFGGNIVCICTRAWWRTKTTAAQNQVMIHELGHQFDMVPQGAGTSTDQPATQYSGSGHVGSHCHNGISPPQASYSGATGSICVMFGATNGVTTFCANCLPCVRKTDLTAGWSAF